ncbi:hypothetical protein [Planomicrobium sp. MB-3u-38]|uniref:hypothetical protein n=1 Tax=Planomicrobium sp. MB-3u-38 TaxID=2058318 RepID=UPI0011AE5502|nr:hypothetical protein [Planomicrobium sp. MB-3u-38]
MEKVKLTKEQADAIENRSDVESALNYHATTKWTDKRNESLNRLTLEQFARALLIGYEIEPEQPKFQLGSEVIDVNSKNCPVITVTNQDGKHLYGYWGSHITTCVQKKNARFATPEEIFWKKTLGRDEVGAFHYGDIVVTDLNVPIKVGEYDVPGRLIGLERTLKFYRNKSLNGIYPAESFKAIPGDSK